MSGERKGRKERRDGKERRSEERAQGEERRKSSDRRGGKRVKRRIPCEMHVMGQWQRSFVTDLSHGGLFVQTGKSIDPGTELELRLRLPSSDVPIHLRGTVARNKRVPPRLVAVVQAGVGVQIHAAPNEYYAYVAEISPEHQDAAPSKPKPAAAVKPAAPLFSFRVRAKQTSGSRSRSLTVEAESPERAEARALGELGENWKVLGVERA